MILETKTFNLEVTVKEDKTCYGNKWYLQCEDSDQEDHSFLKELKGKKLLLTCIVFDEKLPEKGGE